MHPLIGLKKSATLKLRPPMRPFSSSRPRIVPVQASLIHVGNGARIEVHTRERADCNTSGARIFLCRYVLLHIHAVMWLNLRSSVCTCSVKAG